MTNQHSENNNDKSQKDHVGKDQHQSKTTSQTGQLQGQHAQQGKTNDANKGKNPNQDNKNNINKNDNQNNKR